MNTKKVLKGLRSLPAGDIDNDEMLWHLIQGHDHPAPAFARLHYEQSREVEDYQTQLLTDIGCALMFADETLPGHHMDISRGNGGATVSVSCSYGGVAHEVDPMDPVTYAELASVIVRQTLSLTAKIEHALGNPTYPISFLLEEERAAAFESGPSPA
jgi:hypothetical protein